MCRRHLIIVVCISQWVVFGVTRMAQSSQEIVRRLSVAEVWGLGNDPNWIIVDTRPTDAYNGWKLEGVKRGGHVPGAVDFPASWLNSAHEGKNRILAEALRSKRIDPSRHVLLYGTNSKDRERVANFLREAGCRHLYAFDFTEWANDATKPLVRYPNFHLLVPPVVVKQLLDGKKVETFENAQRIKFAEVSWGAEDASYSKGHVPRSFHVNTDHFEPPPSWKLGTAQQLKRFADRYGFQASDTVILSSEDPTASYRLAIVLRYMGVADVRVLNGGFAAWKTAGFPVEAESTQAPMSDGFGAQIPLRPKLIDETPDIKVKLSRAAEFTLVDTRTWAEFVGRTSGYTYHSHRGRIPQSVYGQASFKGKNSLQPYRNIDNTMRNAHEIQELWKSSSIDTNKHLSFMCGGGWRAAEVLTFAHVMGVSNSSLYSDGWIGWSNDRANPTKTGPIEKGPNEIDSK